MTAKELLVVGELNIDLIFDQIDQLPKIGTEIIADKMTFTLGSSSAIMASNIAAMGVSTAFCGKVGNDDFGNFVLEELQKKRVDTEYISKSRSHKTGITVAMNYDQDRANVTYCGAMEALTLDDIPWDALSNFSHLHLSNFFIQRGIRSDIVTLFKKAKAKGISTSLDLQWDPDNAWDFDYKSCLPYIDIFMPNTTELLALTNSSSIAEGIEKISPYIEILALKMGETGSIGVHRDKKIDIPAFQPPDFVDAIGAGDSFNAGFIKKYLEKAPLAECLQYGNLMGAICTTAPGGTGAFLHKEAFEAKANKLLESMNKIH